MNPIDPDDPEPKHYGLQIGVVTSRDDPRKLGRVKVRVPGILEPESAWAWPLGLPGGGSNDAGTWWIPKVGSEVGVFFKQGDPDYPYYTPAHWGLPGGQSEVPEASGGEPDVITFAMGAYDIVVDTRSGSKKFRIVDKDADDNLFEYDGATRTLQISATTAIQIKSTGQVDIQGLIVSINGIVAGSGQL